MTERSPLRSLASVLVLALLATAAQAGVPLWDRREDVPTLAPMLKRATPAVVNIKVTAATPQFQNPLFRDPFFRWFFGIPENAQPRPQPRQAVGSGVIVDADKGYVLTNHHVIDKAETIEVTLKDQRTYEAKLIGSDSATDIALLQIRADHLTELPLGDSDRLEVGDFVVAIGNPFGLGQTVTSGIVSALGRSGLNIEGYEDFIQTDASINPGNSGGALVNLKGELVGINTAIIGPAGGNVGIGFAVPVNMAHAVMKQLIEFGEVRRGQIGVIIQDLTPELAEALGLDQHAGAVISQVQPDSPAEKAGLQAGDVVVRVDGRPVKGASDLRNYVGLLPVGRTVTLEYLRDGKRQVAQVRIGKPKEEVARGEEAIPALTGAVFKNIEPGTPQYGQVEGVLVAEVAPGSPAWRAGLRQGDVILAVNRQRVRSVDQLKEALKQSGRAVALNILRGNMRLFLVIQK